MCSGTICSGDICHGKKISVQIFYAIKLKSDIQHMLTKIRSKGFLTFFQTTFVQETFVQVQNLGPKFIRN